MPYKWTGPVDGGPVAQLRLWPHRSMSLPGFVRFFGATAALAALPLLTVLGTPVLWGVLPFFLVTLGGLWTAIRWTYRTGEVTEELRLWPDRVVLIRSEPRRAPLRWEANPHWVRAAIHQSGGPVPNYLTLTGAGRTVEIGAFLSEDERLSLWRELPPALEQGVGAGVADPRPAPTAPP